MLGSQRAGETKKCGGSCRKVLPLSAFKIKNSGEPASYCSLCQLRVAELRALRVKEPIDIGKRRCTWCNVVKDECCFETNPQSGSLYSHCVACIGKHRKGQVVYDKTAAGQETRQRYYNGDCGRASVKRHNDKRVKMRKSNDAMKEDHSVATLARFLISGKRVSSPKFVKVTSFDTEEHFLDVVKSDVQRKGLDWEDYGMWQLEHKIPREAYDFTNPEDVLRCWSPKNVHALSPQDNRAKAWKLIDHYIMEAGVENFPTAWNDKFPDEVMKEAHKAKCIATKQNEGPSKSSGPAEEASGSDSD